MQQRASSANISSFESRLLSFSDPHSFLTLSLSISVSHSSSPSVARPGLLCPSSSFYFMPRPSLAQSSSITTRTLHFALPPHPHPFSTQLGQIQMQPSVSLSADTLLCDSSLHLTRFSIHHITTSLSPSSYRLKRTGKTEACFCQIKICVVIIQYYDAVMMMLLVKKAHFLDLFLVEFNNFMSLDMTHDKELLRVVELNGGYKPALCHSQCINHFIKAAGVSKLNTRWPLACHFQLVANGCL